MVKAKIKLFLITFISSIFVIWLSVEAWSLKHFLTASISSNKAISIITIPKGASTNKVVSILVEHHLVREPTWFKWLLIYEGKTAEIKAGEIAIDPRWDVYELIDALVKGEQVAYPVSIIAGDTFAQTVHKLSGMTKLKQASPLADFSQLAKQLDIAPGNKPLISGQPFSFLEGQLLPETYFFIAGGTVESVLKRAHIELEKTLSNLWEHRQKNLPFKNKYEALILASIVEKETAVASERPIIAGVFINRLRKGMRLQTDPTVIYGMAERFQGNISKKDLQTKTPYNTYRINGLPPTPIALPSRAAIEAVMQPSQTKALYFVAKGNGEHTFSNTLVDHNKAVRQYLKMLRAQ